MQDIDTNRKAASGERQVYRDGGNSSSGDSSFNEDSAVPLPQIHGRKWPGGI